MSDPWFKFYSSDWLSGTASLTPTERGIYITLIALMYEADGPIDRNERRLARVCGCTQTAFKKALSVLVEEHKIIERNGQLSNSRALKEIEERQNRSKKATEAANTRWENDTEKSVQKQQNSDAEALPMQSSSNAMPEARNQIDDDDSVSEAKLVFRERILLAAGHAPSGITANGKIVGSRADFEAFENARRSLAINENDAIEIIGEVMARRGEQAPPNSLKYFIPSMQEFAQSCDAPSIRPKAPRSKPGKSFQQSQAEADKARKLKFYEQVRTRNQN